LTWCLDYDRAGARCGPRALQALGVLLLAGRLGARAEWIKGRLNAEFAPSVRGRCRACLCAGRSTGLGFCNAPCGVAGICTAGGRGGGC
jgi:hypothetical protein